MIDYKTITKEEGLTFDDVLLVPQHSISSRRHPSLSSKVTKPFIETPIITANMDTITELEMAKALAKLGGRHHPRFMDTKDKVNRLKLLKPTLKKIIYHLRSPLQLESKMMNEELTTSLTLCRFLLLILLTVIQL